jgi:hypothetical protein
MAEVRKISVSMPAEVIERVKLAAEATGESVSGWLTSAALQLLDEQSRLAIGLLDAERMVTEYEEEFGPIPPEVSADVDEFFDRRNGASPPSDLRDVG